MKKVEINQVYQNLKFRVSRWNFIHIKHARYLNFKLVTEQNFPTGNKADHL